MSFQKILVPLDGSEHSGRALEIAIQLAKKLNSKLVLLTVYSGTVVPVTSPELALHAPATIPDATSAALSQMAIEGARNHSEKILAEAKEKARLETIEVETELAEGNAVETIVRKSKEEKFDMIVMGARGLGKIRKLFIGSVSEGVIKNAHCPVLIVK